MLSSLRAAFLLNRANQIVEVEVLLVLLGLLLHLVPLGLSPCESLDLGVFRFHHGDQSLRRRRSRLPAAENHNRALPVIGKHETKI